MSAKGSRVTIASIPKHPNAHAPRAACHRPLHGSSAPAATRIARIVTISVPGFPDKYAMHPAARISPRQIANAAVRHWRIPNSVNVRVNSTTPAAMPATWKAISAGVRSRRFRPSASTSAVSNAKTSTPAPRTIRAADRAEPGAPAGKVARRSRLSSIASVALIFVRGSEFKAAAPGDGISFSGSSSPIWEAAGFRGGATGMRASAMPSRGARLTCIGGSRAWLRRALMGGAFAAVPK